MPPTSHSRLILIMGLTTISTGCPFTGNPPPPDFVGVGDTGDTGDTGEADAEGDGAPVSATAAAPSIAPPADAPTLVVSHEQD